jgi:UDP-glucose 4-epimerase
MKLLVDGKCVTSNLPHTTLNSDFPRRGDVPDLTADPSLAEKELGFKASQDLETMCRDLWNWQTKNPQGYGEQ